MKTTPDEITLRGMRFDALVGILAHERTTAQPIEIDLTVSISDGTGIVDYGRLYDVTAAIFRHGHIDYLEDIAERVAAAAFVDSSRVVRVRVAVRKPKVSLGGPLDHAEVRIDRMRATDGA